MLWMKLQILNKLCRRQNNFGKISSIFGWDQTSAFNFKFSREGIGLDCWSDEVTHVDGYTKF